MPLHNNEIILEIQYPIAPSFDWLLDDTLTVHDGAKFKNKGPTVRFLAWDCFLQADWLWTILLFTSSSQ